jgi:hypothetical protein
MTVRPFILFESDQPHPLQTTGPETRLQAVLALAKTIEVTILNIVHSTIFYCRPSIQRFRASFLSQLLPTKSRENLDIATFEESRAKSLDYRGIWREFSQTVRFLNRHLRPEKSLFLACRETGRPASNDTDARNFFDKQSTETAKAILRNYS